MHERCSACNLLYLRNQGDLWLFMIITDRVPILVGIAALYFGIRREGLGSDLRFSIRRRRHRRAISTGVTIGA